MAASSLSLTVIPVIAQPTVVNSPKPVEYVTDQARAQELDALDRRIGRFVSGKVAVYVGNLTVVTRGSKARKTPFPESRVVASLEEQDELNDRPGPGMALTVVSSSNHAWVRFSQPASAPGTTLSTRPRPMRATAGLTGSCTRCLADLSRRPQTLEVRRFLAKGQVRPPFGAKFEIEAFGRLELVSPARLRLEDLELLNPGLKPLLQDEVEGFSRRGGEGVLSVKREVRQRLPPPEPPSSQVRCDRVTLYSAERFVDLDDLSRFGVRDVELLGSQICCRDPDWHGEGESCREEEEK